MDACFYFKKRLCEDKRFSVTVLHVIHAINNSETILRLLFFIHGQTLCCFVCFPLCLEHPCNFALGLPLPVALEVKLDVIPMQLPTKMWLHGAGRWKFWNETAVLPLYRAVSPMKRFFVEHCPQTVFFDRQPRHPPHQSHSCLTWCNGLCTAMIFVVGWCLLPFFTWLWTFLFKKNENDWCNK